MSMRLQGIGMTSQRTRERLVKRLREEGIRNDAVLNVIRTTPRHIFVDEALASRAYEDTALPIGHGQTISQPYMVARMTELLLVNGPLDRVLEIGTGSGYQTAILAQLVERVYTVERISALMHLARARMRELKLRNVRFKHDDGNCGWAEHQLFSGIIVTAAAQDIPESLLMQLDINGRLIIPAEGENGQVLRQIVRTEQGFEETLLDRVQFVPMLGGVN